MTERLWLCDTSAKTSSTVALFGLFGGAVAGAPRYWLSGPLALSVTQSLLEYLNCKLQYSEYYMCEAVEQAARR